MPGFKTERLIYKLLTLLVKVSGFDYQSCHSFSLTICKRNNLNKMSSKHSSLCEINKMTRMSFPGLGLLGSTICHVCNNKISFVKNVLQIMRDPAEDRVIQHLCTKYLTSFPLS